MEPFGQRRIRTAIVMSRLPRLVDPAAPWLAALRATVRRVGAQNRVLLDVPGIAGADFVRHAAIRLNVTSELLNPGESPGSEKNDPNPISILDRAVAMAAEELFVLHLRPRGNWHQLLIERLRSGRRGVVLVDHVSLQHPEVRQEMLDAGALNWMPAPAEMAALPHASLMDVPGGAVISSTLGEPIASECLLSPVPPREAWTYLIHTTRACPGPWPEQGEADYFSSVIDQRSDGLHSALETLIRIVRQRRLIASGRTIRGAFPVVSFTAVPLQELPELRCFRTHRGRWDFEPYGVLIRRSALLAAGARPVLYGSEETWQRLPDSDRPYFQLTAPESEIDWSREQEWRNLGDLDLDQFQEGDLALVVPTYEDARKISPHTNWPITLWPEEIRQRRKKEP